jgi:hypothetical protein
MKRGLSLSLAPAFAAITIFLVGCDSDIYLNTEACRDNDDLTQCPADARDKATDAKQANMKVQK